MRSSPPSRTAMATFPGVELTADTQPDGHPHHRGWPFACPTAPDWLRISTNGEESDSLPHPGVAAKPTGGAGLERRSRGRPAPHPKNAPGDQPRNRPRSRRQAGHETTATKTAPHPATYGETRKQRASQTTAPPP